MPYLAIFEQGGSADIFSLFTGGRDDTSKSVIVTLSNLWWATNVARLGDRERGAGGRGPRAPPPPIFLKL